MVRDTYQSWTLECSITLKLTLPDRDYACIASYTNQFMLNPSITRTTATEKVLIKYKMSTN